MCRPERKKATEVATPRGKDFPPVCRLLETPVRERGTPPRSRALASKLGPPIGASGIGGRHGRIEGVQVSSSPSLERRIRAFQTKGERSRTRYPDEEEDEIQSFWGQLWFFPTTNTEKNNARVIDNKRSNLLWIRKDLWEARSFEVANCHLVGEGDSWTKSPSKLNFAEDCWARGEKKTFVSILKGVMAGRGRGQGPRPKSADEDWEGWGGGDGSSILLTSHRSKRFHRRHPSARILLLRRMVSSQILSIFINSRIVCSQEIAISLKGRDRGVEGFRGVVVGVSNQAAIFLSHLNIKC